MGMEHLSPADLLRFLEEEAITLRMMNSKVGNQLHCLQVEEEHFSRQLRELERLHALANDTAQELDTLDESFEQESDSPDAYFKQDLDIPRLTYLDTPHVYAENEPVSPQKSVVVELDTLHESGGQEMVTSQHCVEHELDTPPENLGQESDTPLENVEQELDTPLENVEGHLDTLHMNVEQELDFAHQSVVQEQDTLHENAEQDTRMKEIGDDVETVVDGEIGVSYEEVDLDKRTPLKSSVQRRKIKTPIQKKPRSTKERRRKADLKNITQQEIVNEEQLLEDQSQPTRISGRRIVRRPSRFED